MLKFLVLVLLIVWIVKNPTVAMDIITLLVKFFIPIFLLVALLLFKAAKYIVELFSI